MRARSLKNYLPTSDSVGLEELELWPDAIWRLAALLRAGCSPALACTKVATYLASTEKKSTAQPKPRRLAVLGALRTSARQDQGLELARAQMGQLFAAASARAHRGLSLAEVYLQVAQQNEVRESVRQGAAMVAACWQVGERTGASLAQVFEHLASYLETEIDLRQQRETALSGPRATGRILSWLPFIGLGLGILMGTDPVGVLVGSIPGAAVGVLGLGLAWCGNRWTAHLISRAEEGR
ncbi:MAG: type II secretion system F family protein [Rothia sp. (in: high G+C Gram-positive bacteria)]|nr:type II secretion system F family protein [Rothia sp. (in: high G+C Gram-positive bacteria)]